MKIRFVAATVLTSPMAGATTNTETCPQDYVWQVDVDRLHVWED